MKSEEPESLMFETRCLTRDCVWLLCGAGLTLLAGPPSDAAEPGTAPPAAFAESAGRFLQTYCSDCHSGEEPEGQVVLENFLAPASRLEDRAVWEKALRLVRDGEMPPADGDRPPQEEVVGFVELIADELSRFDCEGKVFPGRVTIRRLNRAEYDNTIRDLLGVDFQPADDFPSDDVGAGFDNIAEVLSLPPILVEKYLLAAEQVVNKAWADPQARARILVCDPSQVEEGEREACYAQIVEAFATRAYRRPVTRGEAERLLELGRGAFTQGAGPDEALQIVLQAALVSPHFLFRIEPDVEPDDPEAIRELNDYELASRLSYFLWSSMPDAALFDLASQGRLRDPEVRREQVARMLADPKASALVQNFAGQWLQLRDLSRLTPDPERFPQFDEPLRASMQAETERFFAAIMREDRSILEFLTADYSFVDERLARHYGLDDVRGAEFRKVSLPPQRRGVLTQGSILLLTSNPTRTSPVKRGKWILENFLDDPPPPPAPGVAQLEDQPELLGSLRERTEQHRNDPGCAVCHRRMDPLGFGLENFDAIGAWRETDGRYGIDPSGSLPGGLDFGGPKELMEVLSTHKSEDFCRCLAKKMLTYALGRELDVFDRCTVDRIVEQLAENQHRFSSLVLAIVNSDPFTKRGSRGPN